MGFIHQQVYRLGELVNKLLKHSERDDGNVFMVHQDSADEYSFHPKKRWHVRFPVELAVRYGEEAPVLYHSFVLNTSRQGVFVTTDSPLPEGTILTMHFFIPPDSKLLAELKGEVVKSNAPNRDLSGMHIEFFQSAEKDIQRLNDYLEEKQHLLDRNA